MRLRILRWFLVIAAAVLYGIALLLPAHYESAAAIDGSRIYTGLECLLAPIELTAAVTAMYPEWWANPAFIVALLALIRRWNDVAFACSVPALLLALAWPLHNQRYGQPHLLAGFWFWAGAMGLVMLASVVLQCENRRRGVQKLPA